MKLKIAAGGAGLIYHWQLEDMGVADRMVERGLLTVANRENATPLCYAITPAGREALEKQNG